jgi:hypothetical protein
LIEVWKMFEDIEGCDQVQASFFQTWTTCEIEEVAGFDQGTTDREPTRLAEFETNARGIIHFNEESAATAPKIEKPAKLANIHAHNPCKTAKASSVPCMETDSGICGLRGVLVNFVVIIGKELRVSKRESATLATLNLAAYDAIPMSKEEPRCFVWFTREGAVNVSCEARP